MLIVLLIFLALSLGVVRFGLRLAWGLLKFVIGIGLFALCPALLAALLIFGFFGHGIIPTIVLILVLARVFRRI